MNGEPAHWGRIGYEREAAARPEPKHDPDFDALTAGLFATGSGRAWLAQMRKDTIEKHVSAAIIPADHLRVLEARREFVREIEASVARGLQPRKAT